MTSSGGSRALMGIKKTLLQNATEFLHTIILGSYERERPVSKKLTPQRQPFFF